MKTETKPATSFAPRTAPRRNNSMRENVFGKIMLFHITIPAPPATVMAKISYVPCTQMVAIEPSKNPCYDIND